MILGGIERGEIIVIRFDFGTFKDFEAHARKNVDELIFHERDGMQSARLVFSAGHRDVDFFFLVFFLKFLLPNDDGAFLKFLFHALLKFVDYFPEYRAFLLGKIPHAAHDRFELRLEFEFELVKSPARFRLLYGGIDFRLQSLDFFLHIRSSEYCFSQFLQSVPTNQNALRAEKGAQGEISAVPPAFAWGVSIPRLVYPL